MATRFLRLDLSAEARDYEPVALRLGLALLDREGANYRVLNKRLGRLISEPQWDATEVSFFVSDETGARHHNIQCEPATAKDLAGIRTLREDLEAIKTKLQEGSSSSSEASVVEAALAQLKNAIDSHDCGNHLFRYRDDSGKWRLVWCWGYQRRDQSPGDPKICTNPLCRQLFVRRRGGERDCPGCVTHREVARSRPRSRLLVPLLVLIAAAAGFFAREYIKIDQVAEAIPPKLSVQPVDWKGPAGSQREYRVVRSTGSELTEEDVTSRVVSISDDPKVARFRRGTTSLEARSAGRTVIHFYLGDEEVHTTVEVEAPRNPQSIRLEPPSVAMGIGSTETLRLWGVYGDGQSVDLTEMAQWLPVDAPSVSCHAGHLEGVHAGEATIVARFQATPEDPLLSAEAAVQVVDPTYSDLQITIDPITLVEGSTASVQVMLVDADGVPRPATGSSSLVLQVEDPLLATVEGDRLRANQIGTGKVVASFGDLQSEAEFNVLADMSGRFVVSPSELELFVGEVAELEVISGSSESIQIQSSSPSVADVFSGRTVVGKAPGKAVFTVTQEAREIKVEVEVKSAELKSLAFVPSRMSVPLDRSVPIRLVGLTHDDQQFDLSPDSITWERLPTSSVAEVDIKRMQVLGRTPTDEPERLAAQAGGVRASGEIDVVTGPLRVELTPTEPEPLRPGQSAPIQCWVRYGDGTRAQIDPQRVAWRVSPADSKALRLDPVAGTVHATQEAGSISVSANYQGYTSNRVTFQVLAEKFALRLESDRSVMLVGDRGLFRVAVEAAPAGTYLSGARFESKDPSLLTIDRTTGQYHALAAGKVFVGVLHPNATNAAVRHVEIRTRDQAKLLIRPDPIMLLVDARQELKVSLATEEQEDPISLLSRARPSRVSILRPNAVHWQPPLLTGLQPSEPFEIVVEHEGQTARAVVQVLAEGGDLRIMPELTRLSPGQAVSPIVQQQVPDTEQWLEIDPAKVSWAIPDGVRWTPAQGALRPRATPDPTAQGSLTLTATFRGKSSQMIVEVANEGSPSGDLEVAREPDREEIAVGDQQRFAIMVRNGRKRVPVAGVRWQEPFENEYVQWKPPVLIAKGAGHRQLLHAWVGDKQVAFEAQTVPEPPSPLETAPPPTDRPTSVRFVTEFTPPITLLTGAEFSQFRVEAVYPSRPAVDVTADCLFQTSPGPEVTFQRGSVLAREVGTATLTATFNGVETADPLSFRIVSDVALSEISVEPQRVQLREGESATLRVTGFVDQDGNRSSVGQIGQRSGVEFQSQQPEIVRADGPVLTAVRTGSTQVVVQAAGLKQIVDVEVVSSQNDFSEPLDASPRSVRLAVGESKLIGPDITVRRGTADLSSHALIRSSNPDVARFDASDRSVVGISPGNAVLSLQASGQSIDLPVTVVPDQVEGDVDLRIEPVSSIIAVGETTSLRATLVDQLGQPTDRTSQALMVASPDHVVAVQGNQITGLVEGKAEVRVRVVGVDREVTAQVEVVAEAFTSLEVSPSYLFLGLGQTKPIQIQGIGPRGRRTLLGDHPDLKVIVAGPNPNAVNVTGNQLVRGAVPGDAMLQVSWKGLSSDPVSVRVEDQPMSRLRIVPSSIQVEVGGREPLQVLAMRGDVELPVTAEDGLTLTVDDPSIAELNRGTLRGMRAGVTSVNASIGSLRAAGRVTVAPGPTRDRAADMPAGLRFIPDVLRLQLGVPGGSVRLVKVSQEGTVEDLDHRADLEITTEEGKEVVSVQWTASGPVLVAKKVGEADVIATAGNLRTRRPLRVLVVDPTQPPRDARLQVQPDPLRLQVGQTGEFQKVTLIPGQGPPLDVDYIVRSNNDSVVATDGRQLRALATGIARVTVRPVGLSQDFAETTVDVTVEVEPAQPSTPNGARLVLKGPSRGTVGEPLLFRAVLEGASSEQEVTHEGASLVLSADETQRAVIQPGCVLVPSQAGTLRLKARYKNQVSNAIPLVVDPPATAFARLELELESRPMTFGERRSYKVWGSPVPSGPRQDLTHLLEEASGPRVVIAARPSNDIVRHERPSLVATAAGTIRIGAQLGELRSEIVEIDVFDEEPSEVRLRAEPTALTIRVGEQSPPIRVSAQSISRGLVVIDAQWRSEDETILSPDPQAMGRFLAQQVGQTQLTASFGGQTTSVPVRVTSDPFRKVAINEKPEFHPGNRFLVTITIDSAAAPNESFEYRVSTVGDPESGQWMMGRGSRFEISSPALKRGPDDTTYHLMLEARPPQGTVVDRYPLSFRLNPTIQSHSVVEENQ